VPEEQQDRPTWLPSRHRSRDEQLISCLPPWFAGYD
jgi:hypothetical protein